jgi:hypothetical protein
MGKVAGQGSFVQYPSHSHVLHSGWFSQTFLNSLVTATSHLLLSLKCHLWNSRLLLYLKNISSKRVPEIWLKAVLSNYTLTCFIKLQQKSGFNLIIWFLKRHVKSMKHLCYKYIYAPQVSLNKFDWMFRVVISEMLMVYMMVLPIFQLTTNRCKRCNES